MEYISTFEVIVWLVIILLVAVLSILFVKFPSKIEEETTDVENYYQQKLNELE